MFQKVRYRIAFYSGIGKSRIGKISGNKYTRDNAEDFPTEIDKISMYVRYEGTHTRRNYEEHGNVTSDLKEYRKSDPARLKPRARLDHSLDRRCARPLGEGQSVKQSIDQAKKFKEQEGYKSFPKKATVNNFKNEEFKEEAKKLKAKKILEAEKKIKKEKRIIKVEARGENERGFVLDDYIKGKIGFLTIISTGDLTGAFHIYFS